MIIRQRHGLYLQRQALTGRRFNQSLVRTQVWHGLLSVFFKFNPS